MLKIVDPVHKSVLNWAWAKGPQCTGYATGPEAGQGPRKRPDAPKIVQSAPRSGPGALRKQKMVTRGPKSRYDI